jgi:hypothetical protein
MSVRQQSKHELVSAQRERYRGASRTAKAQLLDEFGAATGYHRKHARRLFREGPPAPSWGTMTCGVRSARPVDTWTADRACPRIYRPDDGGGPAVRRGARCFAATIPLR